MEVRFHASFVRDLEKQARWLERNQRPEWVDALREGIIEATHLLEGLPYAGARSSSSPLFKLVLRKLPFVVWYSAPAAGNEVVMLRLFHTKQDRPR
jgi:plasmid stabilization system protein ParE